MENLYEDKPGNYYSVARHEIIALIPRSVSTLLDIGCGSGATAYIAKRELNIKEVVGVEYFEKAAQEAAALLDHVLVADIEKFSLELPEKHFDCIILADVLEHTKDPWSVLKYAQNFLNDGGAIIVSLPNIRHAVPLIKIITDTLEYEDWGIMDRTHLKIFTKHTMKKLIEDAGLEIVNETSNYSNSLKFKIVNLFTLNLLKSFFAYQHIFLLRKKQI